MEKSQPVLSNGNEQDPDESSVQIAQSKLEERNLDTIEPKVGGIRQWKRLATAHQATRRPQFFKKEQLQIRDMPSQHDLVLIDDSSSNMPTSQNDSITEQSQKNPLSFSLEARMKQRLENQMYKTSRQFQQFRLAINKKFQHLSDADAQEDGTTQADTNRPKTGASTKRNVGGFTNRSSVNDIKTIEILSSSKTIKQDTELKKKSLQVNKRTIALPKTLPQSPTRIQPTPRALVNSTHSSNSGAAKKSQISDGRQHVRDHLNSAFDIVNNCFTEQIQNSSHAYIENFLAPGISDLIGKQQHIMRATGEYMEQMVYNPNPKTHRTINELMQNRLENERYIREEYITPQQIQQIKEEQVACQQVIIQSGPHNVWKPDKLVVPRYSYLGQIISQQM